MLETELGELLALPLSLVGLLLGLLFFAGEDVVELVGVDFCVGLEDVLEEGGCSPATGFDAASSCEELTPSGFVSSPVVILLCKGFIKKPTTC